MKHAEDDQPTPLIEPAMVSEQPAHESDSDSDDDESDYLSRKPIGPVDPSKSTASGAGVGGGTACVPSTFVVVTIGEKFLTVELWLGLRLLFFFCLIDWLCSTFILKPYKPNNAKLHWFGFWCFPGALGDGSRDFSWSFRWCYSAWCRESLTGRCANTMCKLSHPPQSLLMTAIAATTSMSNLSQVPMAPSAAAMAAAQAIVAAQTLQAHMQAQARSNKGPLGSPEKEVKGEALKKYLQVGNLSPQLTTEQLKQHFSFCGTVVDCSITDSKLLAYIEYSKPEEATAALALNNMEVCGRALNVEIAKSLPQKPSLDNSSSSSLPMMMQQAVAIQQMQFQQAILMQQSMATQQAANKAATMKSATELAAARAAEISRKQNPNGVGNDEKEGDQKPRSPSNSPARSRSKSKSPISYRRRRRSRSYSPPFRRPRSPQKRKSKQDDSELSRHRRDSSSRGDKKSSRAGSRSPRRHKETKSTARDDEETKHRRRTRSRSRTGQDLVKVGKETETHPEVLMILNGNTGGGPGMKEDRRGRSRSRSLETKHRSSRKNELKEDKGHRITEKEVQVRISGRRERRSSPGYSDENKSSSRRKGHSRSREKRDSPREKISKRHERLRSASPGDYNGRGDRPSPVSSE
ncbi:BnaCnng44180D [Brassica napus]|uniref:BnaCnng44180D protein n=1 Tax=Brassica napus TaxID=3708 RepID=A0A078JD62_BRANA|nr:BnaCnng44180D [Brassica napus]